MDKNDRRNKRNHDFFRENSNNLNALEKIEGLSPSMAKHIVHENDIVNGLSKVVGGGLDIINQPICERCEKIGTWDKDDSCYCFSCGHSTKDPITVADHMLMTLKNLPPEVIESLGNLAYKIKEEEDERS